MGADRRVSPPATRLPRVRQRVPYRRRRRYHPLPRARLDSRGSITVRSDESQGIRRARRESILMRSRRFSFQLVLLAASLAFILAILGVYAAMILLSSQGLPSDRRQMAEIARRLAPFSLQQLRPWVTAS